MTHFWFKKDFRAIVTFAYQVEADTPEEAYEIFKKSSSYMLPFYTNIEKTEENLAEWEYNKEAQEWKKL